MNEVCSLLECHGQPTWITLWVLMGSWTCLLIATADWWHKR